MCKLSPKKRLSRNSITVSSNVNINVTKVHKHDDSHDKVVQVDLSKNEPRKTKLRQKIKTLQQQKRRQKVKIDGLNSIIKTLKNRKFLSKETSESLLEQFSGTPKTLIENEIKNSKLKRRTHSYELKIFLLQQFTFIPQELIYTSEKFYDYRIPVQFENGPQQLIVSLDFLQKFFQTFKKKLKLSKITQIVAL